MPRKCRIVSLLLLIAVWVVASCSHTRRDSHGSESARIDTFYTETRIMTLYEQEPERALAMIDTAETSGVIPPFRADLLRAKLFSGSVNDQRQGAAMDICEKLLCHDSVKSSMVYQNEVLELLVNASRMRHDDEQWLRWAMQFYELLRQQGNEAESLRMEAEIGLVMTHLGQLSAGLKKIDGAIQQLDGRKDVNFLLAFVIASKRKITVLRETGRHAEILPVAQRIQDCLADYQAHPDDYGNKQTEAQRADYCDFYGAQALAFTAAAYVSMDGAVKADFDKARECIARFGQTSYGHTLDGRKMIAPTLGRLGDYASMLAIYDEAEAELRGDTMRYDYAEILLARAEAAEAKGQTSASLGYRKRFEALSKVLNDRLHRDQSHDYAARYHAQEQQMEIERQNAELTLKNIFICASVLIILLAIAFATYFFRQKRILAHKNRVLVEQISGAIEYKKRYRESLSEKAGTLHQTNESSQRAAVSAVPPDVQGNLQSPQQTAAPDATSLNLLSDEQLFQYMSDIILREKLFLNPVCDRQAITERFGLSEKRVGAAFSKGSSYKSLASFVRDSRLEYACQLLRQHPEMPIGSVATASGFSNHTRFTADFKTRYSVSPTEFRTLSE